MKKPHGESALSQFEVALEQGKYKVPSELPQSFTFEDILEMYYILHQRLRCHEEEHEWLAVWKSFKRDKKATAAELGVSIDAIRKRIKRLQERYEHCA